MAAASLRLSTWQVLRLLLLDASGARWSQTPLGPALPCFAGRAGLLHFPSPPPLSPGGHSEAQQKACCLFFLQSLHGSEPG